MVRFRHKLSRLRAGLKSQIHAVLGKEGAIPLLTQLWAPAGAEWLDDQQLGEARSSEPSKGCFPWTGEIDRKGTLGVVGQSREVDEPSRKSPNSVSVVASLRNRSLRSISCSAFVPREMEKRRKTTTRDDKRYPLPALEFRRFRLVRMTP